MPIRRLHIAPARARLVALLVAVACAAGLAGCGQAQEVRDSLTYTSRVSRSLTGFEGDLQQVLRRANDAEDPADVDHALRRLSVSVIRVQRELRSVKPPRSVAQLHGALIGTFSRWAPPIDELQRAIRTRSRARIKRGQQEFTNEIDAIQRDVTATLKGINARLRRLSD